MIIIYIYHKFLILQVDFANESWFREIKLISLIRVTAVGLYGIVLLNL